MVIRCPHKCARMQMNLHLNNWFVRMGIVVHCRNTNRFRKNEGGPKVFSHGQDHFLTVKTIFDLLRKIASNLFLWAKSLFLLQFFLRVENGLDRENPVFQFFLKQNEL